MVKRKRNRKKYRKVYQEYFKEDDTLGITFGRCEHSRELKNVNLLVDFDKKGKVAGIEIEGFLEALEESQKVIDRIFSKIDEEKEREI